jgi:hypothetical protein
MARTRIEYFRLSCPVETFTCRERPCDRGAAEERGVESEAPTFKRGNISATIAADVKGFVVIVDEVGRLLDASNCAWRRASLRHDVLSRDADNVN